MCARAGLFGIGAGPRTKSAPAATGIVRGVVVDRADGTPIADVSVRVQDAGPPVKTDAAGPVRAGRRAPGRQTLYVSLVGFILVKRPVDVRRASRST